MRTDPRATVPCRFFQSGRCRNDASCPFLHVFADPSPSATSKPTGPPTLASAPEEGPTAVPCIYFQKGACMYGNTCRFLHDASMGGGGGPRPGQGPAAATSTSDTPCQYFQKGVCIYGSACKFLHDAPTASRRVANARDSTEMGNKPDDFLRSISGIAVQFAPSGDVLSTTSPGDISAVHVANLPPTAAPDDVRLLFAAAGFQIEIKNVRTLGGGTATVRSADPSFSKKACAARLAASGVVLKLTPIAGPMPAGAGGGSGRVDCKKIHVSWHKGVRTVRLHAASESRARRLSERFASGHYTILGHKVTAGPAERRTDRARTSLFRRHADPDRSWSVALSDVPFNAERGDVESAVRDAADRPRLVELGAPTHGTDVEEAAVLVQSLVSGIGPLEYWELSPETTARRAKASARFLDTLDAHRAMEKLDGEGLPWESPGKLTVKIVYSSKFRVECGVYAALESTIRARLAGWKADNLSFYAYSSCDALLRYRTLKIEGETAAAVASAKRELEGVLEGVVAVRRNDRRPLWDASLRANGSGWAALRELGKKNHVLVRRDVARSELRLFGEEAKCKKVEALAEALVDDRVAATHVLELDDPAFDWLCKGGFRAIAAMLGKTVATLDVVSAPKKLLVFGSAGEYDRACDMVGRRENIPDPDEVDSAAPGNPGDCVVCWTEAELPVRAPCGHVYCQDCFRASCSAAGTGPGPAPGATSPGVFVACHGNNCKARLPLPFLQEHLTSALFESMLDGAFAAFVIRNGDKFRHCPSPDCDHVYRVTAAPTVHVCARCVGEVCTACHGEPHPAVSCEAHRAMKAGDDEGTREYMKSEGIQNCPGCGIGINKVDGCNHVTCGRCGVHMCWKCLEVFGSGKEVYEHLHKVHGGLVDFVE